MRDVNRNLLITLAAFLTFWLIWVFWPLSLISRWVFTLLIVVIFGALLWRQWAISRACRFSICNITDGSLPPEEFEGAVILVCGDGAGLFGSGSQHSETQQGWYLWVKDADNLPLIVQHFSLTRPALIPQLSVLLSVIPECHLSQDDLTQNLRSWQRAVAQCRRWLGGIPPVWMVTWVSPPAAYADNEVVWFTTVSNRTGIHVYWPGDGNITLTEWVREKKSAGDLSRISLTLWLDGLLSWQASAIGNLLTIRQNELPALKPCAQGICMVPVASLPNNLWQQYIAAITGLAPRPSNPRGPLPLPELLLSALPRKRGIGRRMAFWSYASLIVGVFLALAMLASFINNQRLILNVSDHLVLYHQLNGEPLAPKLRAQQRLKADGALLDTWHRRGEPMGYRLGLYQGLRLVPPIEAAIADWAPPPPSPPVIKKMVNGPTVIRLDSMSLFDSGKSELKAGSTKMLVNSLVDIKAKPGWLIVVSGHTDNTGNAKLNQTLSLRRAEAVRDWMRDTGDVPESCFAVQGYGADRPVATNDTSDGRALNRRVEISLVPQANACQIPGNIKTLSKDDDDS